MMGQRHQWKLPRISDRRVVDAMGKVPRHLFVPEDLAAEAYDEDRALPIGEGQTTPEPLVVATMAEALRTRPRDKVLEIGTGSGYQTAVLAEMVETVYSIEIEPALAERAKKRLGDLGCQNIRLRVGDGYEGWIEEAPFDAILVTAAVEEVPPALMDQLKEEGGRLVLPIGTPFGDQELTFIEKRGTEVVTRRDMPVHFVSFRRPLSHHRR